MKLRSPQVSHPQARNSASRTLSRHILINTLEVEIFPKPSDSSHPVPVNDSGEWKVLGGRQPWWHATFQLAKIFLPSLLCSSSNEVPACRNRLLSTLLGTEEVAHGHFSPCSSYSSLCLSGFHCLWNHPFLPPL